MNVVILQPHYLPWPGVFEQMRQADCYVHLDDVQWPQGRSFSSRVQVKSSDSVSWLTMPIIRSDSSALIHEVLVDDSQDWRKRHLKTLSQLYGGTESGKSIVKMISDVLESDLKFASEINIKLLESISKFLNITPNFIRASQLKCGGKKTDKIFNLAKTLEATRYITGHGATKYLDCQLFEDNGIRVEFMDYRIDPYPQRDSPFTPFVSIVDGISSCGKEILKFMNSKPVYWRDFLNANPADSSVKKR